MMRPIAHSDSRRPGARPMLASVRQSHPRPRHAAPMAMPPPPPGAASTMAVVGSSTALHSLARPGAPPPPPPTLAQLQHQQQRPLHARHPATVTGQNAHAYHPHPYRPFAATQRPFAYPPASRQIVDALCEQLLQNPHFFHSVMDLAIRTGISLQVSAASTASSSSSTPVAAIDEKHALAAIEASTMAKEADQDSTAQISIKEPLAKTSLSKGQRKRRRIIEKAMQKRVQSYLSKLSQSMIRRTIKDLNVADKTRLSKVNALLGVDLAPDRAMECRRKLLRGCKTNPEFIHDVAKELDRMIDSANGDESVDSKERRRKVKAFKNLAGYHDLIVKSLKADQQLSEEGVQTASAPAAKQ